RYQHAYGLCIIPIHIIAYYLLFFHTNRWTRAIKIGYLLNQTFMFTHDIWTCFLFRGYPLLPYPIILCSGLACHWIGPHKSLAVEHVFMVHAIVILLFSLLMMHQQILPPNSSLIFPTW
ncbi:hypothetical protein PFISCL1PPCAC_14093, partial [Pristionchus fissidentatus]